MAVVEAGHVLFEASALMSWLAIAGPVVLVGALLQGAVGFGMNLIAAPLLALVDPALVPVPLLLVASAHGLLSMAREHSAIDWRGVGWVLLGRVPGTAIGVLAVASLAAGPFSAIVGVAVLTCVGLSIASWRPQPRPATLLGAGVASGTFGTAASIGGPPIALVYQHEAGPRIRATLAACFGLGTALSLAGLAAGGQLGMEHVVDAAWLMPFLVAGFLLSGPVRPLLDNGRTRSAVLLVAAASALALIGRALAG